MIDKRALAEFIGSRLEGTDCFLTEVKVSKENDVTVEIDSMGGIDIDFCIELSRAIEEAFPREPEDYSLEVGSAGITSPLKVKKQYEKNLGREVEVLSRGGKKYVGTLLAADDEKFSVRTLVKQKQEGKKKAVEVPEVKEFSYDEVNAVIPTIKF